MRVEAAARASSEALARVVLEHQVTYEVSPSQVPAPEGIRSIGYDLRLFGHHPTPLELAMLGCPSCRAVWNRLAALVKAVLPEKRASTFATRPFNAVLHYEPSGVTSPRSNSSWKFDATIRPRTGVKAIA